MCKLGAAVVGLDECESSLTATLEPVQLDALPDSEAARVAAKFVASIENNDIHTFARLIHPRGLHHGEKKNSAPVLCAKLLALLASRTLSA